MESSLPSQISLVSKSGEADNEVSQETHVRYKQIILSLPRGDGWGLAKDLYQYQGFWYLFTFLEGTMSAQEHFKAQPTDIIVSSAPKSGTTWLKALTFAIVTRTRFDDSMNPLLTKVPHDCIPFLEFDLVQISKNRNPEIPLVSTHMPYTSLPKSIIESGCKIVYICRDPKDAFVSAWHFVAKTCFKDVEPTPLVEAFERFCQGISVYGPYWDHVLGYWKASLESPEKVLFLKYEDLKNETDFHIKKMAEFIGHPFSIEEEEKGMEQKIISMCSFENLSNLEVNKSGKHRANTPLAMENNTYFRKGKIGDWKNYLTAEMAERLDQITQQKLSGSGLTFLSN